MRYAVINKKSNLVENVIIYDGGNWNPPDGTFLIKTDKANIGDLYDQNVQSFKPWYSFPSTQIKINSSI